MGMEAELASSSLWCRAWTLARQCGAIRGESLALFLSSYTCVDFRYKELPTFLCIQPAYDLSSHRGVDRPFRIGSPELYSFALPNGKPVDPSIQLCCRHELHLVMPDIDHNSDGSFSREGIVNGNDVVEFARKIVPSGIRVEVPIRQVLSSSETNGGPEMIVFLIVYCGESIELTRSMADVYREKLETEISTHLELRENRRGRLVSRPFSYSMLPELIESTIRSRFG